MASNFQQLHTELAPVTTPAVAAYLAEPSTTASSESTGTDDDTRFRHHVQQFQPFTSCHIPNMKRNPG